MNILVDLIAVAILVFCAWRGKKNGFIKTFFSFFGTIISFILAALLSKPVGSFLASNFIVPVLKNQLIGDFLQNAQTQLENLDFSSIPKTVQEILDKFGVTAESFQNFTSQLEPTSGQDAAEQVVLWIVEPIAVMSGVALSFVLLFIILYFGIKIAVRALDLISKLPVLNFSNHLFGLTLGALTGVLFVFLFAGILRLLEPSLQGSEQIFLQNFAIEKTILIRFILSLDFFGVFLVLKGL